jgi:hypothetical protein
MTTTAGVYFSRRYLAQCYASLVSRLAVCSTVGQVWAITERLDQLDALLERTQGEAMTADPIRDKVNAYAAATDFDRGDLGDDRERHVRPGQVWADANPRQAGRTLRVERIECHILQVGSLLAEVPHAVCTVLTRADGDDRRTGHQVTIRVSRMRPTSTGYRLVTDVPTEVAEP